MATQDVACGARLWKTGGQLRATLIVKATFTLVDGDAMRLVSPAPLAITDEFALGDPQRSILVPSDLVPYRPRGEVVFVGHAHAPSGNPSASLATRLVVSGARTMVDKSLQIFGERVLLADGQASQPVPFTRMPVVYERSAQSADENPIGIGAQPGAPAPNVVDLQDPLAPAGFGAIAPHWPVRRRMLRALDPELVAAPVPEIPDAFAWSYFQAAPPDQRCGFFEGNERVALEGLHADKVHFESRLPGARAGARLYASAAMTHYREFPLVADTLYIDGDRGLVCLVWRGNLEVDANEVAALQVLAGIELPGRSIPWPETSIPIDARSPSSAGMPAAPSPQPQMPGRAVSSPAIPAVQMPERPGSSSSIPAVQAPQRSPSSSSMQAVASSPAPLSHVQGTTLIPVVTGPVLAHALEGVAEPPAMPRPPVDVVPEPASSMPVPLVSLVSEPRTTEAVFANLGNTGATINIAPEHADQNPSLLDAPTPYFDNDPSTDDQRTRLAPSAAANPLGATMPTPMSLVNQLLARETAAAAQTLSLPSHPSSPPLSPESYNPTTIPRPKFDDPETYQPDSASIARIVEDAEASLAESVPPPPPASEEERFPSASPPTMAAAGIELVPRIATVPLPATTRDAGAWGDATSEMDRVAAVARARAEAAAVEGAALAREHIAAGGMRKVRPPKTTIRGLADPERLPEAAVHDDAAAGRGETGMHGVDPETKRFDAAATTARPNASKLAELQRKAGRGEFLPLDEASAGEALPTREFSVADLAREGELDNERISLEPLDPLEPVSMRGEAGAVMTAVSAALPAGWGMGPPTAQDHAPIVEEVESRRDRLAITGASSSESVALMRSEVMRRLEAGEPLGQMMLEGADLSGLDLSSQNLVGSRMRGASFRGARLTGADLSGCSLDEADFTHSNLDGANLERASLKAAIFNDASLKKVAVGEASFEGAIGTSAMLEGATGGRAVFTGARFDCARFDGARLTGADFTEAIIDGASFEGADLSEARLYEARGEAASFVRAVLTEARFDGSVLVRGRFQGVDAADSLWDRAELDQASFEGAKLAGASFTQTSCRETTFTGADLGEARFNQSVLWGARFHNVDVHNANFTGADLRGALLPDGPAPATGPSIGPPGTSNPPGS